MRTHSTPHLADPLAGRPPRGWAALPERGSTGALMLIHWIAVRIGRGTARLILHPIALYYVLTAGAARRASRAYLRRAFGRDARWTEVYRHVHCFAATILDRALLLRGGAERFDIEVHNGQVVLDALAAGRGCLLLGSHLGSFDVLRVADATGPRLPVRALMDVQHNRNISRFIAALNPEMAATIIPACGVDAMMNARDRLDEGCLVGILADRPVARDRTARVPLLGGEAALPTGPLALAAIARCPVVLGFALYRGGRRYDVHFELLAERVAREPGRHNEEIARWVRRYAERLEHYMRLAPYNWFNFYDFWADDDR
jgi:predicted LPLAT superfamily acyltransferase